MGEKKGQKVFEGRGQLSNIFSYRAQDYVWVYNEVKKYTKDSPA